MGRQRNNPQMKGKEEDSERMLTEIQASQLSGIEFKAVVIRKLNELSENYQNLQGSYKELTENYISMKKDIVTINKSQEEIRNTIYEMRNIIEGTESRPDESEDLSNLVEDKVGKNSQTEQQNKKD